MNDSTLVTQTPNSHDTNELTSTYLQDILHSGQQLNPEWVIQSPNQAYIAYMQGSDGNFVVYAGPAIWASNTSGNAGAIVRMQTDGNMVVVGAGNNPLCKSNTSGYGGAILRMQDDGNLVVVAPGNYPVWASLSHPCYPI